MPRIIIATILAIAITVFTLIPDKENVIIEQPVTSSADAIIYLDRSEHLFNVYPIYHLEAHWTEVITPVR
jgi:hypothetical protein